MSHRILDIVSDYLETLSSSFRRFERRYSYTSEAARKATKMEQALADLYRGFLDFFAYIITYFREHPISKYRIVSEYHEIISQALF